VTTNQDELVERAAAVLGADGDVLHVHGSASRPLPSRSSCHT
jgi:hypothetical protein